MIKTRLKDVEIKITELADYLQISRPTMYKFIEMYDAGDKSSLNKGIIDLFDYIEKNEYIGRKNVLNYIFDNLAKVDVDKTDQSGKDLLVVKEYLSKNVGSDKAKFIVNCAKKNIYDEIIGYLNNIEPLLKKKKLTNEEEEILKPYKNLIKSIKEEK